MPDPVRRRGTGPEITTGRGIGASSDRRTNVRWSELELAAVEAGAKAAGQPSVAAYVREVTLAACGFAQPVRPTTSSGPAPWEVLEPGEVPTAHAQVSLDGGGTIMLGDPSLLEENDASPLQESDASSPPAGDASEPAPRRRARRSKKREPSPAADNDACDRPPPGWRCTRERDHEGPCAAVPCDPSPASTSDGSVRSAFRGFIRSVTAKILG